MKTPSRFRHTKTAQIIKVLLVLLTSLACSLPAVPLLAPRAAPTAVEPPVVIVLVQGDENRLPENLRDPILKENAAVSLKNAAAAWGEAVLVSREQFFLAGADPDVKQSLMNIIFNHKVLLVYGGSTVDIHQVLQLGTPTTVSQNTHYVVGSISRPAAVYATGGLSVPNERTDPISYQELKDYVVMLRSVGKPVATTAPYPADWPTPGIAYP